MDAPPIVQETPPATLPSSLRGATPAAQSLLFQRLRWHVLRNSVLNVVFSASMRLATIILLSLLIWGCVFALNIVGFDYLQREEINQRLAFVDAICLTLFDLLFLSLALMLVFSGGIILYSSLFTTAETAFLLSTPAAADQVFSYKFQGAVGFSSWAFVLLGSPVVIAYGIVFHAPWYFYAVLPLYAFGFVLLPGSAGALACLLIVSLVPQRRKQVLLGSIGLMLLAIPAWVIHLVRTAKAIHWTHDAVKEILSQFSFAEGILTPSHWMTQGLMAARRGDVSQMSYRLALVLANGLMLYVVTAWVAKRLYRRGFDRLATGGALRRRYGGGPLDNLLCRLLAFLDPQIRLLIVKDFRTFRRDPTQWAQISIFLGLIVLYGLNMRRFYSENLGGDVLGRAFQNPVSLINLAATALLLCSYTGRFIYPLLSLEGRKFWILGLLPLRRERLLWGKFAFSATWSLLAAEGLILVSDVMLAMPAHLIAVHAVTIGIVALGLSGISVGLGAAMPNFRESDPSKIAVGFGGTLNLVAGLLFLLLEVLLMAGPWHLRMASEHFGHSRMFDIASVGATLGGLALGAVAIIVPMRLGARTLRRMEF